jgi:VWFA-related protein
MRSKLLSGALVSALVAGVGVRATEQEPPVFRATNNLVRVFVTVTNGDGRLVTGLGRQAFELKDAGKVQPIEVFDASPVPIRIVALLDVSGSMAGNVEIVRRAADELFNRLGDEDLARVGFFGETISFGPTFTRNVEKLRAALPKDADAKGPTPLWMATEIALRLLAESAGDHRRVILILSDGKNDLGPFGVSVGGKASSSVTADEVVDHARRTDTMIYGIGLRSRLSNRARQAGSFRTSLEDDVPDPALARVAAETGGGYTEIGRRDDLGAEFARVVAELHSQYLLGFSSTKQDGKVHDLDVKVRERGMKARSRKSYLAPASGAF